ncbi:hypothetical protein DPMN_191595 [Dreissena polymorpha]|uniref:CUB domain-containing protein n=1 Tax=Dreissena polymorpha TaxID=45954 RepID=A0A9D4BEE8_DREPO|nr:hypothetical protein DPMN_191595 [Dreissena polymorpha]
MESHTDNMCIVQYLEVFNGPNASSPSVGKFCGPRPPMGFKSLSNSVRIVFFAEELNSAKSFRLTYTFSTQGENDYKNAPFCVSITKHLIKFYCLTYSLLQFYEL